MKLGMVGLGKMGANMTRRLMRGGHEVVVTDLSADNVKHIAGEGAIASASLDDFVSKLGKPRVAWLMVPAGAPTEQTVQACRRSFRPATFSSTAETPISKMTSAAPSNSKTKASITWMSAPAAASGDSSAATA